MAKVVKTKVKTGKLFQNLMPAYCLYVAIGFDVAVCFDVAFDVAFGLPTNGS